MVERRFLVTECQHCFRSGEVHRFYLGSVAYVLVCQDCACDAERDYSAYYRLSILADQNGFPLGSQGDIGPRGATGYPDDSDYYRGPIGHTGADGTYGPQGADYYGVQGDYKDDPSTCDTYQIAWAQEGF
jgi:hypothetical protein